MGRILHITLAASLALIPSGLPYPVGGSVAGQQFAYERSNTAEHHNKPYVLLISIDGYRYDYLDLHNAPNLERLASEGVRADSLIPGYPADTFPNHYGIATGMYPETHGIVANAFFDRARDARFQIGNAESVEDGSWYGGTPLWVAAETQGMVTASYFWVGTDADIQGLRPTYSHRYDGSVPHARRIGAILDWLSYPVDYRPHLMTLYFSAVDSAGHTTGPASATTRRAIARLDTELGVLFEGIDALDFEVNIIVVSDHGMLDLDPERVVYLDALVDLNGVRSVGAGAHVFLYVADDARKEAIYSILKEREDHFRVYRREDSPASWHANHDRVGDLIVQAEPPYSIRFRNMTRTPLAGGHGYDPYRVPEMHGVFFARGPNLATRTRIPSFENIHIYPLIMKILGLEIADNVDGRLEVLDDLLR